MIRDVFLAGIVDIDIRREALGMSDIQEKSTNDVVTIIDSREIARNATPLTSVSTMSSHRRGKQQAMADPTDDVKTQCPECGKQVVV